MSKKCSTFAPAFEKSCMVVLAQLVEHRIVVPSVKGSSPLLHPQKRVLPGSFSVIMAVSEEIIAIYFLLTTLYKTPKSSAILMLVGCISVSTTKRV